MTRQLQKDRSNPNYWIWMSAVVETVKEREFCLREAIKLDPTNPTAIRGLRLSGNEIDDPSPIPPLDPAKLRWKTSLEIEDEKERQNEKPRLKSRKKLVFWLSLALAVVALGTLSFFLTRGRNFGTDSPQILKFSLVTPATSTPPTNPLPVGPGPAPLWMLLEATYTPTPVLAATPHTLSEAYQKAKLAYDEKNWPLAIEYFNQVLYSEPNSPDVQYHIAEIYRFQGLVKEAATAYEVSIKINPAYAPAYIGRGRVSLIISPSNIKSARESFTKALELDPTQYEGYYELAKLELAAGNPNGALSYLAQVPPNTPASVLVEITRAEAYLLQGDSRLALETALIANQIDVTNLPVYKVLSRAYLMNNQVSESILPLDTYLAYVPEDPEALGLMAMILIEQEKYDDARIFTAKSLEINKTSVAGLLARGEIYLHDGLLDEAAADFVEVIRMDKNSFDAALGISRVQFSRNLFDKAYEYAGSAYQLARGNRQLAAALFWRARALIGLEEDEAAVADLLALLSLPEGTYSDDLRSRALKNYEKVITATPGATLVPNVDVTPSPSQEQPAATATPQN